MGDYSWVISLGLLGCNLIAIGITAWKVVSRIEKTTATLSANLKGLSDNVSRLNERLEHVDRKQNRQEIRLVVLETLQGIDRTSGASGSGDHSQAAQRASERSGRRG